MKSLLTVPQRKFGLIVGVNILLFISLWLGFFDPSLKEFFNAVVWLNFAYITGNVAQKVGIKFGERNDS